MNLVKSTLLAGCLAVGFTLSAEAGPKVLIETSHGNITLELNEEKAPVTVKNFLHYVEGGFFESTVFHRVISNFMIQGGGFALTEDKIIQKKPSPPIENESKNGLSNERGTIAMARTGDPHSATCQFFINLKDNSNLDYDHTNEQWGYTVFGKVIEGMDTVDNIAGVETDDKLLVARGFGDQYAERMMSDVPTENVVIKSAKVID